MLTHYNVRRMLNPYKLFIQENFLFIKPRDTNISHNIMIRIIINIMRLIMINTFIPYVTVYTMYQEHDDISQIKFYEYMFTTSQ